MFFGAPRVQADLVASKRKVSWVELLSGLFSSRWVATYISLMSLLPPHSQSFITAKLLRALHCSTRRNMDAPAWGNRFSFLWALNVNSELSSRKYRCKVHTCEQPVKQKGELYIIIPYFLTTWTHGKLTHGNSALTILSIYFCYLRTV